MTSPAPQTQPTFVPSGSTRDRRELAAWRNAMFATFFLAGFGLAAWVARLPAIRDDVGLSTASVGLVLLAGSGASVVGLIIAPPVLARMGARAGMVTGLSTAALGLVAIGIGSTLFGSLPLVAIGLALFGLGNGAVDVMMNVDAAEAEREIGRTIMPLMHAFFSFGTVAGAALAAALTSFGTSVAVHLGAVAVVVVVGVVIAVRFVPRRDEVGDPAPHDDEATDAPGRRPWSDRLRAGLSVWGDPRLLLIGVVVLGMAFAEGSANDWIAIATVDGHGFDETAGALMLTAFMVAMTAGRVLGGPVLDRFGRVPVLRALAVIAVSGLALFIFGTETWMLVAGAVLWGLGASLGFPVGMSAAADHPTQSAARVSAVAIIGYMAFLVGPPLIGFLGEAFGILNGLLVVLGLMVLSGLAAPAARERSRTAAGEPEASVTGP
ncbi:MFS transporter [Agromyces mangrovi Wang et al. 2018]|uniref:MFS transporter n=1 Tax=Agromyces mangrovi TaxID=1858653 RepID=UPI002573B5CB|nr:MFS transporter [Agromyces mangrovi]BDZ64723.1 MFS transporter [Agromyces mangrovi]